MNGRASLKLHLSISGGLLFGLAMTVAIVSVLYAAISAEQQPHPGFTQFWMLPLVQAKKSCAVRLGVHSFESASVTYHITITIDGAQVISSPPIIIAPQQEWGQVVPITSADSSSIYVDAQLYRSNKANAVYREIHLTLYNCVNDPAVSSNLLGRSMKRFSSWA